MPITHLRLDIQGLRALAVALVVVFHLTPATLSGGYIGVDVFFVISGFLITQHLLREVERHGTVNLLEFWARRVRRLLPAALLVLAVSAVAVLLFLPRVVAQQNFTEIAFAGFYVLNWHLASNSVDYLAADNHASLAQHYWSLSVEEQFYIIWPLLVIGAVWVASKVRGVSRKSSIAGVLFIVFAASLAFSVYETATSQPSAYFITTTRAWEFAVGGLVAMIPMVVIRTGFGGAAKIGLSWAALATVIGSAWFFDATTPFPGWIALIPVLATAFLLWIGDSDSTWSPQFIAKSGPIQFIGDASYSIYLWHWPIILVFVAIEGRNPGWKWMLILAAVTVVLGALTKHFVEDPIRKAPGLLRHRIPTFALMAGGMATIAALTLIPIQVMKSEDRAYQAAIQTAIEDTDGCFGAYAILNDCDNPYAMTDTVNSGFAADDRYHLRGVIPTDQCVTRDVASRKERECNLNPNAQPSALNVVAIGDSHAEHLLTPLSEAARALGWSMQASTRGGCSGVIGPEAASESEWVARCVEWGEEHFSEILADL